MMRTVPGLARCTASQASSSRAAMYRHAWTKKAPDPQAMSQILRASSSLAERSFHCSLGNPFGGADVDQRLQRVLHDGFGQALGRVVRAAAAPVGPCGDEDAARA